MNEIEESKSDNWQENASSKKKINLKKICEFKDRDFQIIQTESKINK